MTITMSECLSLVSQCVFKKLLGSFTGIQQGNHCVTYCIDAYACRLNTLLYYIDTR